PSPSSATTLARPAASSPAGLSKNISPGSLSFATACQGGRGAACPRRSRAAATGPGGRAGAEECPLPAQSPRPVPGTDEDCNQLLALARRPQRGQATRGNVPSWRRTTGTPARPSWWETRLVTEGLSTPQPFPRQRTAPAWSGLAETHGLLPMPAAS